jgi:hypothetical protein
MRGRKVVLPNTAGSISQQVKSNARCSWAKTHTSMTQIQGESLVLTSSTFGACVDSVQDATWIATPEEEDFCIFLWRKVLCQANWRGVADGVEKRFSGPQDGVRHGRYKACHKALSIPEMK